MRALNLWKKESVNVAEGKYTSSFSFGRELQSHLVQPLLIQESPFTCYHF